MTDRSRFSITLPADAIEGVQVLIVGCGGIGGYTSLLLAKMGLTNQVLVDKDVVEEANVHTQVYEPTDISVPKVEALGSAIDPFVTRLVKHHEDYTLAHVQSLTAPRRIYIAALDNMETRREFFADVYCNQQVDVKALWIDPRMTLEFLEVNAFGLRRLAEKMGEHLELYYNRLNNKTAEYEEAPCGEKALPGTGMWAAHTIATIILRWCKGERIPHLIQGTMALAEDAKDGLDLCCPMVEGYYASPVPINPPTRPGLSDARFTKAELKEMVGRETAP